MSDLATQATLFLCLAAFAAGFIDSIAGGGAMITVPALLLAGLPPVEALGTAKLQGLFGTTSSTIKYASNGHIDLRKGLPWAVMAAIGGGFGAFAATIIPIDVMRLILPFLLVGIALFFALKPDLGDVDRAERITPFLLGLTIIPAIGFYDGLFGPGGGSFFMLSLVALAGFGVLKATGHAKLLNLGSTLGSFLVFLTAGGVLWKLGILMGIAAFLGARLGATMAIARGAALIKPLLIVVSLVLAAKLMLDPLNPLRGMLGF
jgi:hypothetical protein